MSHSAKTATPGLWTQVPRQRRSWRPRPYTGPCTVVRLRSRFSEPAHCGERASSDHASDRLTIILPTAKTIGTKQAPDAMMAVRCSQFLFEEGFPMSEFQRRDFLSGAAAFAAATTATLAGTRRTGADD